MESFPCFSALVLNAIMCLLSSLSIIFLYFPNDELSMSSGVLAFENALNSFGTRFSS